MRDNYDTEDIDTQLKLAYCYEEGTDDIEKDIEKSIYWYKKASDQGDHIAQFEIGYRYYWGDGLEKDLDKSMDLFQKSAKQDNVNACIMLSRLSKDDKNTLKWITKSAELGDTDSQYTLGNIYKFGLITCRKNKKKSKYWLLKASGNSHPGGQSSMGDIYYTDKDYRKALDMFSIAAFHKDYSALMMLGQMYGSGVGVDQDLPRAIDHVLTALSVASDREIAITHHALGELYTKNEDADNAIQWLTSASKAGMSIATYDLGELYFDGVLVGRNYRKAFDYFTHAIQDKIPHFEAFIKLGHMYANGLGVPEDNKKSTDLLKSGNNNGYLTGRITFIEFMKNKITIFLLSLPFVTSIHRK